MLLQAFIVERDHVQETTASRKPRAPLTLQSRHEAETEGEFSSASFPRFLFQGKEATKPSHQDPETTQGSVWKTEEHRLWKSLFPINSDFSGPATGMTQMFTK